MSSGVRVGVCVSTIAIVAALAGCAVVDQYSGRAIVYNLEAEQAQDQAMVLNIVRAYLRRPMQFTTVSTITGIASASGSIQYTLPTNVPFRPATQGATGIAAFPPLPTWLFGGSMSGGPAFTVPVLDTQEFYQGILKAIPGQIWDLYLQANYPPDLLFNLFVQRIVIRHSTALGCPPDNHTPRCEFTFYNYVASNIEIDLFQQLADYLLWLGLTTEALTAKTVPFNNPTNINIRYVGAPGKLDTKKDQTAEVVAPPGGAASGEASATPKAYKLCFAPRFDMKTVEYGVTRVTRAAELVPRSMCGYKPPPPPRGSADVILEDDRAKSTITPSGLATVSVKAHPNLVKKLIGIAVRYNSREVASQIEAYFADGRTDMEITVYMRNTEGMIYYLGEVVRRALKPDLESAERYIFVKRNSPYDAYPWEERCEEPSKLCNYVFRLIEGDRPSPGDMVSIQYGGHWYSVVGSYDPEQPDLSTLTLEFVKQQIALNSSAKSLPQSSVITTVGQ